MDLTRQEIERIAIHHLNELYPELPGLSGKAEDFEDIFFLTRDDDFVISDYIAMLYSLLFEIEESCATEVNTSTDLETDDEEGDDGDDMPPEDSLGESGFNFDGEQTPEEDAMNFIRDMPANCREFLAQAEFALENDFDQDAFYRIGFVAACVKCFESFGNEDPDVASNRAVATAWAYLPYIGCVFEFAVPEEQDEEYVLGSAAYALGLVHGSLWFSNTDFPLQELTDLLEKIPVVQ